LLLAVAHYRDACLIRVGETGENVVAAVGVIERRAIDGDDQVAIAQSKRRKGPDVATRIHPVATQFAVREHRLRP